MKDNQIHSGLTNQEVRNFLAKTLVDIFDKECEIQKEIRPRNDKYSAIDNSISNAEWEISQWEKKLELLKHKRGVLDTMKVFGWQEYDVSDLVTKNSENALCRSFIGAYEEYDMFVKLMATIELESK